MPRYENCPLLFLIAYSAEKPRRIEEALEKNMNALKVAQNLWLHRAESQNVAADIRDGLTQFLGSRDSLTVTRLATNDFAVYPGGTLTDSIRTIFTGIHLAQPQAKSTTVETIERTPRVIELED